MNPIGEPQQSLALEVSASDNKQVIYVLPCCSSISSTKTQLAKVLYKNLRRVSELRFSMKATETSFELENFKFSRWKKLDLDFLLIYKKVAIYRIVEVNESLPENELYPPIKPSSSLDSKDFADTGEKIESVVWSNFHFNESDEESDEEMAPPPKSAFKKGFSHSTTIKNIRSDTRVNDSVPVTACVKDMLKYRYRNGFNRFCEQSFQDSVETNDEQDEETLFEKSDFHMSSRRQELVNKRASNKISRV